jgi:predicted XRE-type DNA-binding protein
MAASVKITESKTNIFLDMGFEPAEAAVMALRAELMAKITEKIKASNFTQVETADILQVSQARVSELINGKFNKFSLDMLTKFAERLGLHVELKAA